MNVKVSIIIPVYNVAPYLDACLSSCINQTFQDIEIIVVNDGSPDTSYQIIAAYAAMDDRIVVVNKENEGLIYARKSGLDIARGEYVYHLDGDDYIESNAIEELYNEAIETGADYVMASVYWVEGNRKNKIQARNEASGLYGQDLLFFLIKKRYWVIWGRLIRKELFDGIVYRKVFMGEDLYFNMQIALKVKKAAVVDSCLYNYLLRGDSVTNMRTENTLKQNLDMVESVWFLFEIYSYDQRIERQIANAFFPFFVGEIIRNNREITSLLRKYYWDKKNIKMYLWKRRIVCYFVCAGNLYIPQVTRVLVMLGYKLNVLLKKIIPK